MASRPNVSRGDKLGCETAMKVRGNDHLEGAHLFARFLRQSPPFCATFWKHLQRRVLYTESVDNICFVLDQRTFVCAPQGGWFFSPKKIHSATGGQFTEIALLCHSLRLLVSPLPSPTWLILGQDSCAV